MDSPAASGLDLYGEPLLDNVVVRAWGPEAADGSRRCSRMTVNGGMVRMPHVLIQDSRPVVVDVVAPAGDAKRPYGRVSAIFDREARSTWARTCTPAEAGRVVQAIKLADESNPVKFDAAPDGSRLTLTLGTTAVELEPADATEVSTSVLAGVALLYYLV